MLKSAFRLVGDHDGWRGSVGSVSVRARDWATVGEVLSQCTIRYPNIVCTVSPVDIQPIIPSRESPHERAHICSHIDASVSVFALGIERERGDRQTEPRLAYRTHSNGGRSQGRHIWDEQNRETFPSGTADQSGAPCEIQCSAVICAVRRDRAPIARRVRASLLLCQWNARDVHRWTRRRPASDRPCDRRVTWTRPSCSFSCETVH
ncbi:hypothetical protein BDW22DRAFT_1230574 [Trametopsis cervina]|nr:hypothetical protein BDW22DRAFT_1230574 [Trametopsis cervina]